MPDKEFLMRRKQEDLRRLQKHHEQGSFKLLQESAKDPTVKIQPVSLQNYVSGRKILIIQLGLRYMESFGVPPADAIQYAEAFGHEGKLAWRIERYEKCVQEKFGSRTPYLSKDDFMKHMTQGSPRVLDQIGYNRLDGAIRLNFERKVMILRAALRAAEMVDVDAEEMIHHLKTFGKAGSCAYYIEDYGSKQISRRERTRGR